MSLRGRIFALTYERQLAKVERAGLAAWRAKLLTGAHGDVIEIGAGTGANLRHYGPAVRSLTLTEPEPVLLRRLERATQSVQSERPRQAGGPPAVLVRAAAEELPFADAGFDTAVSTLVLCVVRDQARALGELRRVLRPGGSLLFLEHVRSEEPRLARRQDRVNPLNRLVAGCECNRSTLVAIEAAGFIVTSLERAELPRVPAFVRPLIVGVATSPL